MALFNTTGPAEGKAAPPPPPDTGAPPIKKWSFTALSDFERCPYSIYLKRVQKVQEPPSPAADRGNAIHTLAEDFVQGVVGDLPNELKKYKHKMQWLREQYELGKVSIEDPWGYTREWEPTSWADPNCWGMMKLDAIVHDSAGSAVIIDHKTGKKFGNEMKHRQQGVFYTVGAMMRYPEIEFVEYQFWYLDQGEEHTMTGSFNRDEVASILLPRVEARALKMTEATQFPPRPSTNNCKWCIGKKTNTCTWAM